MFGTYLAYLNIILLVVAGVGTDEHLLNGIISSIWHIAVGHPFDGETGPGQSM